nr:PREDICTED: DNA endonuclease RBBP8 isoform X1 [Lepisosteus oculatus]XP_015209241.1 PREDICTED: DNA endonuclease RBBP8 isoform X1 [Lepisosteus oculatus]XP_015209242.1 PREDICTED: DNA endonuclease RBBP8 isoform X1 [Lepisosteus oculatus]
MNNAAGGSPGSGLSSESSSDTFSELLVRMKDCHDSEVQGLQIKISKLKKERCLDAQRLEEFYTKNQQLREQQKALQDNVKVLEDRLRAGLCDRCAVTEEHMKKKQVEFENVRQQNLRLITELMNERNSLQDENKKLCQQLDQLKKTAEKMLQATESDQEEGVIPDSPVPQVSQSVVNRMRRKRDNRSCRFSEKPSEAHKSPPPDEHKQCTSELTLHGKGVLVPETCSLEEAPISKSRGSFPAEDPSGKLAGVVAETLGTGFPEESESLCVLGPSVKSSSVAAEKQEHASRKLQSNEAVQAKDSHLGYAHPSPDSAQNRDWLLRQRSSPVFGSSGRLVKKPDLADERSPSLLGQHVKAPPLASRLKALSEDIPRIAPLKTGLSTGLSLQHREEPGEAGGDRPVCVNGKARVASPCSALVESSQDVAASKLESGVKRRSEAGSASDRNNSAVSSRENVADDPTDKPLDLSDRPHNDRSQGRERKPTPKDRLKQTTLFDLQQASQNSLLKLYNGRSVPSKDSREDPYLQEAIRRSISNKDQDRRPEKKINPHVFRIPATPPGNKMDTEQLLDIKTPDAQEPIRKKSRVASKDCEQTSVLQPNPCAVTKRSPSERDDGKPPATDMTWSLDPGADLSQYKTDSCLNPEAGDQGADGDSVDADCTFVSSSVLLRGLKQDEDESARSAGGGQRGNDSLAEIFDRTVYGEYESCPRGDSLQHEGDLEEGEKSINTSDEKNNIQSHTFVEPCLITKGRANTTLNFPHVDVVRRREERKKLQGHTCKECEIYYADLPEEERKKKLSSCSRHRFRYIPPSTPENFWEVGFPSTQTCVDRGYIKDDIEPPQRTRRRRPYNAIFSPKGKEQKT